jgi:cyclopropane-fatty-acyl-phospholipid synthase
LKLPVFIMARWTTPHLSRPGSADRQPQAWKEAIHGNWLDRLVYRVKHLLNRNTKVNGAKYPRPLRPWQCVLRALAGRRDELLVRHLETATKRRWATQNAKVRRALRIANIQPGDRVLEIGCGWGALAEMAWGVRRLIGRRDLVYQTTGLGQQAHGQARRGRQSGPLRLQDYRATSANHQTPFDVAPR